MAALARKPSPSNAASRNGRTSVVLATRARRLEVVMGVSLSLLLPGHLAGLLTFPERRKGSEKAIKIGKII